MLNFCLRMLQWIGINILNSFVFSFGVFFFLFHCMCVAHKSFSGVGGRWGGFDGRADYGFCSIIIPSSKLLFHLLVTSVDRQSFGPRLRPCSSSHGRTLTTVPSNLPPPGTRVGCSPSLSLWAESKQTLLAECFVMRWWSLGGALMYLIQLRAPLGSSGGEEVGWLGWGNQDMSDNWQTHGSDQTSPCILGSLQHSASKTLTAISFIGFIQSRLQRATLQILSHAVFWQKKKRKNHFFCTRLQ